MRLFPDVRTKFLNQARFPDSRLACHQHELTLAVARPFPATEQQAHIVLTPDEWCQGTGRGTADAPASGCGLDCPIETDRTLDALELMRTSILDEEQARYQFVHRRRDKYRIGFRSRLHPRL